MERSRADLQRIVDEARSDLLKLPDTPARAALLSLCDFVLTRTA